MADAKKAVEKIVEKVSGIVEVELNEVKEGFHSIFLDGIVVHFENGVAKVESAVAKQLKEHGFTK